MVPRLPLFARIFTVILAGIVAVQILNFFLVITVRPPVPPIYSVEQLAAVLKAGPRHDDRFIVVQTAEAEASSEAHAMAARDMLSHRLGIDASRVRVVLTKPSVPLGIELPLRARAEQEATHRHDGLLIGGFEVSVRQSDGSWLTLKPVRTGESAWQITAVLWMLIAVGVAAPLAWFLAHQAVKPVSIFVAAAERVGRDPHAPPISFTGPAEFLPVIRALNRMQARLARYVDDRTAMLRAIAHDLRTPLMRLSLRLERISHPAGEDCAHDLAELQAMVQATSLYVDSVSRSGTRRRVDLRSLIESIVDGLVDNDENVVIRDQGLSGSITVIADPVGLRTALASLVSNALRFAGDAEINVRVEDEQALVEVRDHGPGVPIEDIERVFEPFYRLETSRNRETGGTGLGLASARSIALAHGGDLTLTNHPDGGALARLSIPLAGPFESSPVVARTLASLEDVEMHHHAT